MGLPLCIVDFKYQVHNFSISIPIYNLNFYLVFEPLCGFSFSLLDLFICKIRSNFDFIDCKAETEHQKYEQREDAFEFHYQSVKVSTPILR